MVVARAKNQRFLSDLDGMGRGFRSWVDTPGVWTTVYINGITMGLPSVLCSVKWEIHQIARIWRGLGYL